MRLMSPSSCHRASSICWPPRSISGPNGCASLPPPVLILKFCAVCSGMQAEVLRADDAENRADLADYVAGRLGLSSTNSSGDPIYNYKGVLDAAEGNFLIAKALIDEIRAGHLRVEELLNVKLAEGHPLLPPGLQLYYERSFARLFPADSDFAPAGSVLALAMAALEPLDLPTLQAAGGLERTVLASVLKKLASFLPQRTDKRFAFFHKSVRDWLDAGTVDTYGEPIAGRFAIDVRVGRTALADWAQAFQRGRLKAPDYVLRHRIAHLTELGDTEQLRALLFDFGWLSAKLARIGIQAVLGGFRAAAVCAGSRACAPTASSHAADDSTHPGPIPGTACAATARSSVRRFGARDRLTAPGGSELAGPHLAMSAAGPNAATGRLGASSQGP